MAKTTGERLLKALKTTKHFTVPEYGHYRVVLTVSYMAVDKEKPEVISDQFLAKNAQDAFEQFQERYGLTSATPTKKGTTTNERN